MNTIKTKLKLPIAILAGMALVGAASAQKVLKADVTQGLGPATGDNYKDFTSTTDPIVFDRTLTNEFGQSRATIYNSNGMIKNRSRSVAYDPQNSNITTIVNTDQTDRFVIDAAGRTGQEGSFTATVSFGGEYVAGYGGEAGGGVVGQYDLNIAMTYPYDDGESQTRTAARYFVSGYREIDSNSNLLTYRTTDTNGDVNGTGFGTYTFEVNFIYGVPIDVKFDLDTRADAFRTQGLIDVDLAHTFEWEGASNFQDANGNTVSNVTTDSTSGFNYVTGQPVPEPGTLLALGAGALGLAARRRRNRNR